MQDFPLFLRERVQVVAERPGAHGRYVLYWMHHAQRVDENPALDLARWIAAQRRLPLLVYQGLGGAHRYNADRHHFFILQSAREVARALAERDIGFHFSLSPADHGSVHEWAAGAAAVVVEQMPVPPFPAWQRALADAIEAPVYAVDARCIVPMNCVTERHERAFAFRKATKRLYAERLTRPYPALDVSFSQPFATANGYEVAARDDAALLADIARCPIDHGIGPVWHTPGGMAAAEARWRDFAANGLATYHRLRNDAAIAPPAGVSRLSPYLHYGCISPLRVAREAAAAGGDGARKYLDELFVWRELAHNFCTHTQDLETLSVLPDWAQQTLTDHAGDPRPALHSWERLARGRTGDALWDLAQRSLLIHGELHNNLRMTWAKQLLQWTPDPRRALAMLIDLNHRYALDGNDPNSYGGLLWALGAFDRPFPPPRPVLGTVRGRDTATHAKRLDVARYGRRVERPSGRALNVGIVGAGVCGLALARTLTDHGQRAVVVDKSRGVGGRCATRRRDDGTFDHGAQFFTARDPQFARHVAAWRDEGWVAPWPQRYVDIDAGRIAPRDDDTTRYVAVPSMNRLAKHLAQDLIVHTDTFVTGVRACDGGWRLACDGAAADEAFDAVVLCAPPVQAAAMLRSSGLDFGGESAAPAMAPCWALLLRFPRFEVPFDAARLRDDDIDWIGIDSSKPGREDGSNVRVVVHASRAFSLAHLEAAPEAVAERLCARLAQHLPAWPAPVDAVAHRWLYARATPECDGPGFVNLGGHGLWLAGDAWRGRSRIEEAWLSGVATAAGILAWGGAETGPP